MSHNARTPDARAPDVGNLQALDHAIFHAPYIVIDRDNHGVATADTAQAAWTALTRLNAASVVGTARPGIEVIDIDPADTAAPAEAGTAVSEDVRDWLAGYGLPYLLRASGRPGGHHLIAVVPAELVDALTSHVHTVGEHHGVAATVRVPRTLRLLSAPHRHGHPSPVLDGTLTLTDLPTAPPGPRKAPKRQAPRLPRRSRVQEAQSPSEREYKRTCAAIRRGLTFAQTWAILGECQVIERGQLHFRKYMWLPAVTEIAAERGLDESAAWELAHEASTSRARELGRPAWRTRYWLPALERAADPTRPRARRLTDTPPGAQPEAHEHQAPADPEQQAARLEHVRAAMHTAAADLIASRRPQRQKSLRAVIDALATAIVSNDGSIDVRTLAEQACVSKGVTVECKKDLTDFGVVAIAEHYAGGADDCHRYALGTATDRELRKSETTRWYTPTPHPAPRTYGRANPTRMRLHHVRERTRWKLRCAPEEATRHTGERWATSQHPAARAARSLWAQRARWEALPEEVQEQRREQRRAFLGTLSHAERATWFDWLGRRDTLAQTAQRARLGPLTDTECRALATAPVTIHLGMRDPGWFDVDLRGGAPARQLLLFNEAA